MTMPARPPARPKQRGDLDLRRVPLYSLVWGVLALVSLTGFAALIAPAAGPELVFTVGSRAGDTIVVLDTDLTAVVAVLVGAFAVVAGGAAFALERAGHAGARGLAVAVCVVVPAFSTIIVSAGIITVATGGVPSDDTRLFYSVPLLIAVILTVATAGDLMPRHLGRWLSRRRSPRS